MAGSHTLLPPDPGEATTAAIPCAGLLLIECLGHSTPHACWDQLKGAIFQHTEVAVTV